MRHAGTSRGEARLVAFIATELERHFGRDGGIRAACAALQRLGVSSASGLATSPGDVPPLVVIPGSEPGVPQWSEEDAQNLRALGIASEANPTPDSSAPEHGGRQPR